MKNLKKVLALVMAFAMAFTMMASAAFTDQADITATDAVDMLSALGVISGNPDGSFKPNGTVTRAEMATMVYIIRNGGNKDASAYANLPTTFKDINGHWAAGYIKFAQSAGIISGKSATQFDPNANVTGVEAALMCLRAAGYDAAKAGIGGATWANTTIALASQKGILDDYSVSLSEGAPRQWAAQLMYNTLFTASVKWSKDSESFEDETYAASSKDGVTATLIKVTVGAKYMGLKEETGIYYGDSKINSSLKDDQVKVGSNTITFTPATGNDWVGEAVKVLFKESKDGVSGLDSKDKIYGMFQTEDTTVVKATLGDLDKLSDANKIKIDGTKYDVYAGGIDTYVNFVSQGTLAKTKFSIEDKDYCVNSGDAVKFIKNDNGKIFAAYITTPKFVKVTGVTSSKITLAGVGSLDIDDDMKLADGVKKDDIVALTTLYNADPKDDDAFNIIEKAEIASGVKVASRRSDTEPKINDAFAKVTDARNKGTMDSNYVTKVDLDATYDFVMYNGYWVAAKKVAASSKDIALVLGRSKGIEDEVKVKFADGTEGRFNYDDDDKAEYAFGDGTTTGIKEDTIYSYSKVGSNKIQLKQDPTGLTYKTGTVATGKVYNEKSKTLTFGGKTYSTTDEAVAFVKVGSKYYTYNTDAIKDIVDTSVTGNVQAFLDDGKVAAFFVNTDKKPGSAASSNQFGYVVSKVKEEKIDDTEYRTLDVFNGTEIITIKIEATSVRDGVEKGAFVQYAVGSNGLADKDDVKAIDFKQAVAVKEYNESRKLLTIYNDATDTTVGNTTYRVSDDVKIVYVDSSEPEGVESGSVTEAVVEGKVATKNIVYLLDDDNEVKVIFVDVDNEMELAKNSGDLKIAD